MGFDFFLFMRKKSYIVQIYSINLRDPVKIRTLSPSSNRRDFLSLALASAAGCCLTGQLSAESHATQPGRDAFLAQVNTSFVLDGHISSKLLGVSEIQNFRGREVSYESYALQFRINSNTPLESRIYQVSHPQLGAIELFLSPVGKSSDFTTLEAVICQRV